MNYCNNIKVIVFLSTLNFFCYLSSMESSQEATQAFSVTDDIIQDDGKSIAPTNVMLTSFIQVEKITPAEQYVPSDLEKQIFGQRIRVENQTGIRLLLKVFRNTDDRCVWKTVLEHNSSVDVGSLIEHPIKITYEPYGRVDGWINLSYTCGGTIIPFDLIHISGFGQISSDQCVFIRIKKVGWGGLSDDVGAYSCISNKNVFLQNLFSSVGYHIAAKYSYDHFLIGTNLLRYLLGLGEDYSPCDINIATARLLLECNPELYGAEQDKKLLDEMKDYIQWAQDVLLRYPDSMAGDDQQSYKEISRQVISFAMQVIEQKRVQEKTRK